MGFHLSYRAIRRLMIETVKNSDAIRQWCIDHYGRIPAVLNEIAPDEPPCEADCPLIAFMALGGDQGQDSGEYIRAFMVRVAISDPRVEDVRDRDGRLLERNYPGSDNVTELLEEYIYPALCEAFNARNFPLSATEETIEVIDGALFQAKAGLTVQIDKAIGEAVPLLG